jgi:hypothetical protein
MKNPPASFPLLVSALFLREGLLLFASTPLALYFFKPGCIKNTPVREHRGFLPSTLAQVARQSLTNYKANKFKSLPS